jgi:hypothetical protein
MLSNLTQRNIYFVLLLSLLSFPLISQTSTQRIKGRLLDQETGEPIIGAEIELMNYVPIKISTTNEYGEYELRGIPIGVHRFLIIHEQYQTLIVPDIEVVIEQPTLLNIKMKKEVFASSIGPVEKESVVIRKRYTEKNQSINPHFLNAVQIYRAEEQNRYAASHEDALQLVSNFEGVQPLSSFQNTISIQGQSPLFTKIKVEGVELQQIQQLQHPLNSSGSFSMLPTERLSDFDLLKAGHSASIKSGIGGQINTALKNGDLNKNHINLKISPLSIGLSGEVPINRKLGQSLALGYRHSSMQWFSPLLAYPFSGSAPSFQDAYFKVNLDRSRSGDYKIFGLIGLSNQDSVSTRFWPFASGRQNLSNQQLSGLVGAKHRIRLAPKVYLHSLLSAKHQQQDFRLNENDGSLATNFNQQETAAQLKTEFEYKIDREHSLFVGGQGQFFALDFEQQQAGLRLIDTALLSFDTELFSFLKADVNRNLSFNAGLRAQYLGLNQSFAFSPSVSMRWEIGNHAIVSHAALAQERLPWWVYLQQQTYGNESRRSNFDLPFMRAYQFMLGYHWRMAENWLMKVETYYHYYDNIASAADSNQVFLLPNMDVLQFNAKLPAMNADARGYHTGVDLSVERFWENNYYIKWNASLMDAQYTTVDGRQFNARYNSRYHTALLGGKQFDFGPWGSNNFGIDARFVYSGGWFYTPIDEMASDAANQIVLDWDQAWSERNPDYFSLDLRFRLSLNKNRWNHQFSLEGINLLNVQAPNQYLFQNGAVDNWSPMGRMILFSYTVDFGWVRLARG